MTQPVDGTAQDLLSRRLRLYAEFGRRRGGLLYVLQAVIMLVQYYTAAAVADHPAALWRPAALLPPFLAYFLLRTRLWRYLYRQQGDLDRVVDRSEARTNLRFALPFTAGLGFLLTLDHGLTYGLVGAVCMALPFAIVAVWGRLPADALLCTFTGIIANNLLLRSTTSTALSGFWRLQSLVIAAWGLYEHWLFLRTCRTGAQTP